MFSDSDVRELLFVLTGGRGTFDGATRADGLRLLDRLLKGWGPLALLPETDPRVAWCRETLKVLENGSMLLAGRNTVEIDSLRIPPSRTPLPYAGPGPHYEVLVGARAVS